MGTETAAEQTDKIETTMLFTRAAFQWVLCVLALLAIAGPGGALAQTGDTAAEKVQPADPFTARRQALEEDRAAIERVRQELRVLSEELPRRLADLRVGQLTEIMLEQARVDADSARLRREDLQLEIANTERRIRETEQEIRDLDGRQQLLRAQAAADTEAPARAEQLERTAQILARRRAELDLERLHLDNLRTRSELAAARLTLTGQILARAEEIYRLQQERSLREAQEDLEKRLRQQQQAHLDRAAELAQRLERERDTSPEVRLRLLETGIQSAEEQAKLIQLDIRLTQVANDLARLETLGEEPATPPKELHEALPQIRQLQSELATHAALLQRKIALLDQQKRVIERREPNGRADTQVIAEETRTVSELQDELRQRRERIEGMVDEVERIHAKLEASYNASLRKNMLDRRPLPATIDDAKQLLAGIAAAPAALLHQVQQSVEAAIEAMAATAPLRLSALLLLTGMVLWLVRTIRLAVEQALDKVAAREGSSFTGDFSLILLLLLRNNLYGMGFAASVLLAVYMVQVPRPGLGIIVTLVMLWIGIKIPVNLAWLLLASPRLPESTRRPNLYHQLAWMLGLGGILAATTILAHLGSLPDAVVDAVDRTFMLYLLIMFLPALRVRRFLHDLLAERYAGRSWFMGLQLVSLLLPLSLLAAALLGLAGYLNLAWSVAWHLVTFVVMLVGWLVARGVLKDLVRVLKNYAVTHSGYGLLWTQEVINPLHKISDVGLFVAAWLMLLRTYGWYGEAAIVTTLGKILEQPLFTLGSTDINLAAIVTTALVFAIVVWLGQWTRAVTYRWLYSGIGDLGARHSLSVFTQYAIVLVGVLITLNMLGLNLTTLTVFAGAVGVGIGFGLQNIANNFISGLLLLVERPLRSGDIVQIGSNEGEISHIGIRSLSMKTFDNQEVIIPNSEVISNAFTNWTHNDDIVRTVMTVGTSYAADPHRVKEILEALVRAHPAVLTEPEPGVLLWDFGDSSVNYRIHYYTRIRSQSRLGVRSEILLQIWDAFKREGIDIPFPHRELYIREWPPQAAGAPRPVPSDATDPEPAEPAAPAAGAAAVPQARAARTRYT
jgi:potassium-dependent mechanosensitive channel